MKKIIALLFVLSVIIFSSFAYADNAENKTEIYKALNFTKSVGTAVPKGTNALFGNERINIHVKLNDSSEFVTGIVTKDGKIEEAKVGGIENPKLSVFTDEDTVKEISKAKDKSAATKKAFDEKKIDYKAVGIFKRLKFWLLKKIVL